MSDRELQELQRRLGEEGPEVLEGWLRAKIRSGIPSFAVLSCIHGNLEALEAVLADSEELGIEELICLGDLVGYGADPEACVDLVRERCAVTVVGHCDQALLTHERQLSDNLARSVAWTRTRLRPGVFGGRAVRDRWHFLESLPLTYERGDDSFCHATPRDPVAEYLSGYDAERDPNSDPLNEIWAKVRGRFFGGHTHIPLVIRESREVLYPKDLPAGGLVPGKGERLIANVGSVGQPRDTDPRACYLVVVGEALWWRRVEYDVERTQAKIRANSKLADVFADRLASGA